ncbi:MAG: hypothetical protein ACRD2Z_07150 [Thermoanaerobaculia bacterium]
MARTRFVSTILAAVLAAAVPPASAVTGTPADAGRLDALAADDLTRQTARNPLAPFGLRWREGLLQIRSRHRPVPLHRR